MQQSGHQRQVTHRVKVRDLVDINRWRTRDPPNEDTIVEFYVGEEEGWEKRLS